MNENEIIKLELVNKIIECRLHRAEQVPYLKHLKEENKLFKIDINTFLKASYEDIKKLKQKVSTVNGTIVFTGYTKLSKKNRKVFTQVLKGLYETKGNIGLVVMNPDYRIELGVINRDLILRYSVLKSQN